LVRDTYKSELGGKTLTLNPNIPRVVKRYEEAFAAIGLDFQKSRPAREFLARMGSDPNSVLPRSSAGRFELLFGVLSAKYTKIGSK
jgi:hypothetical protein